MVDDGRDQDKKKNGGKHSDNGVDQIYIVIRRSRCGDGGISGNSSAIRNRRTGRLDIIFIFLLTSACM